jgi:predicted nucleic acid-binding protein
MSAAPVLDGYALLAFLRDESGGETVGQILERASQNDQAVGMTEAHYAEVQYLIRRDHGAAVWKTIAGELQGAPIEFHPVTRRLADLAAEFKARHPLSLANAFCAALARELRTELITGDPEFKPLENEIKIGWLKQPV